MDPDVAKHIRMAGSVIFDMDGVLVDTEPLHLAVTRQLFGALGVEVSEAAGRALIGHAVPEILATIVRQHGLAGSLSRYETRYDVLLLEEFSRRLRPREGAAWLLSEVRRRGCPVGLASSSKQAWIAAVIRLLRWDGAFDVIVSGDLVAHRKPAPDIYRLAAWKLSTAEEACVAVEDSPVGIEAARAAGMTVVALRTPEVPEPRLSQAHRVISSLREFPLELVSPPPRET